MGVTLNEGMHTGEFLLTEAHGMRSREEITVVQAGVALVAGTVLGRLNDGTTATSVAKAGNTGNGVMGTVTPTNAQPGRYTLRILSTASNAGGFSVEDPDGELVGNGNVAAAFNQGGLAFTLADGATDFAVNDVIYIDVSAGAGKYKAYVAGAADGSGTANAILYGNLPAQTGNFQAVGFVRDCEVIAAALTGYGADAAAKAVTKAALGAAGIIVRA